MQPSGRRSFLRQASLSLMALGAPTVLAQQARPKRVGLLYLASKRSFEETNRRATFVRGMRDAGYAEGKDFVIDDRYADGNESRLASLAVELVRAKVDLILTVGSQASRAAFQSTASIPIVIAAVADPVSEGFAISLAQPGRNVTGLSSNLDVMPKQLDLLVTVVPKISRVAVLRNSANSGHEFFLKGLQASAQAKNIDVFPVEGRSSADFESAFDKMRQGHAGALVVLGDTFFLQQAGRLADLSLKYRLPAIFPGERYVRAGGLMSYGFDDVQNFYLAAAFVDKILKGANPATVPFAQPTRFDLVINRTTAKSLGVRIPDPLLLRADKLID
jgi:putative ABC transport system substrate-binding protein